MNVCKYVNCFKISYFDVSSKYLQGETSKYVRYAKMILIQLQNNIMQLAKYHLTWLIILCTQVIHQLIKISAGETVKAGNVSYKITRLLSP